MSALVNSTLYILGGWDGFECLNSIEKADLRSEQSTFELLPKGSGLQGPIKNGACFVHENKIVVLGGWDERNTISSIFTFDIAKETTQFVG